MCDNHRQGAVGDSGGSCPHKQLEGGALPPQAKAMISKKLTLYILHKPDSDLIIYN